jgi:exodeoxyribonuclease VII small subunit
MTAMAKPPKDAGDTARPSFDARLAQLDQIVLEIDGGKLGLEDSLERYQLGMRLYRELKSEIDAHRRRFEELSADGEIRTHAADDSADPRASGGPAR